MAQAEVNVNFEDAQPTYVLKIQEKHMKNPPAQYPELGDLYYMDMETLFLPKLVRNSKYIQKLTSLPFKFFVAKMSVVNFFLSIIEFLLAFVIYKRNDAVGKIYTAARTCLTVFDILMQLLFVTDTYGRVHEVGFKVYFNSIWHVVDFLVVICIFIFESMSLVNKNTFLNKIMILMLVFRVYNASRINYTISKRLLLMETEIYDHLMESFNELSAINQRQITANTMIAEQIEEYEEGIVNATKDIEVIEANTLDVYRESWVSLVPSSYSIKLNTRSLRSCSSLDTQSILESSSYNSFSSSDSNSSQL